jgi:hypothetical protein
MKGPSEDFGKIQFYDNDYSPIINIYFYETFSTLTQKI